MLARRAGGLAALGILLTTGTVGAQQPVSLADASLEELMNLKVTSVSKKEQELFETASAIFVVTSEDIRRSGATSLAEALRLVPGVKVARQHAGLWQISARGFTQYEANKVLVLVDGISVYNPSSGGVKWGSFEPPLDSIARIEVIRGPGAAVWGSNAMNGVINIITKEARLTQGGMARVETGSVDLGAAMFRYGGRVGSRGHYTFDVGGDVHQTLPMLEDSERTYSGVGERSVSAGFRADLRTGSRDTLLLLARSTVGESHETGTTPTTDLAPPYVAPYSEFEPHRFAMAIARWTRKSSSRNQSMIQLSATAATISTMKMYNANRVLGAEFQNRTGMGVHDLTWSLAYRSTFDHAPPRPSSVTTPERRSGRELSASIQDDVSLSSSLVLTLGSRFEDTDRIKFSMQPSVRLAWHPVAAHTVWAGAARALRTPARFYTDTAFKAAEINANGLLVFSLAGNPTARSEALAAYEAGYRVKLHRSVSVDSAFFFSRYTDLLGIATAARVITPSPGQIRVDVPASFANDTKAETEGAEAVMHWQVHPQLVVDAGYSWLRAHFWPSRGFSFSDPEHQWSIGGRATLWHGWEADGRVSFAGHVPTDPTVDSAFGLTVDTSVPSFVRADARLGRSLGNRLSMSIAGQNLFGSPHREVLSFNGTSLIPRTGNVKLTWQF